MYQQGDEILSPAGVLNLARGAEPVVLNYEMVRQLIVSMIVKTPTEGDASLQTVTSKKNGKQQLTEANAWIKTVNGEKCFVLPRTPKTG